MIATTLAVIFGTAMTSTSSNNAWAANIDCPNQVPSGDIQNCIGTIGPDNMQGTSKPDSMRGLADDDRMFGFASNDVMTGDGGDDTMNGGSGHDTMFGRIGDDKINGDSGNDEIIGGFGADSLFGSSGNDRITHGDFPTDTGPDGSKDDIHCGSGNDEAWINANVDGDTADSDCETVHAG